MNDLRLWIAVLAVAFFGAGTGAGWLLAENAQRDEQPGGDGAFAAYEQRLIEAFDLGPERAEALHLVLELYAQDVDDLQTRHLEESFSELEDELLQLGQSRYAQIRDRVLPAADRERFVELARTSVPWPTRP
jgi:hypothetical protein